LKSAQLDKYQLSTLSTNPFDRLESDLPEIREETEGDKGSPGSVKRAVLPDDQPKSPMDSAYRQMGDLEMRGGMQYVQIKNEPTNARNFELSRE
jgi:hypothetical protein